MKTLITSILTFMCCVGMGQTYTDSGWALSGTVIYRNNGITLIDSIRPTKDTIQILALVTDTTHEYTEPFNVDSATMQSDSENILWWSKGKQVYPIDLGRKTEMPTYSTILYAVRDRKYIFDCGNCEPFWDILYYLDSNMLSLKKSIIIWQVKYLK